MLPNRCSIKQDGKQCPNPPEFIVTITTTSKNNNTDEYMLGVTCSRHKQGVLAEVQRLQAKNKINKGKVGFTRVKSVGTDCIRDDADDLVQIDMSTEHNNTTKITKC